jgi:pilus assembly protein CpaB
VLQNILVLSAGQIIQPETRGQAIPTPVVTLLVSPAQAETLTLAGNEGRIQLVLRNGSDQIMTATSGRAVAELYGGRRANAPSEEVAPRPRAPRPVVVAAAVAAPPAPPPPDEVTVIRGTQKSVEVMGAGRGK